MSDNQHPVPWLAAIVIVLTLVLAISAFLLFREQNYLALTASGEPGMVASLLVISFGMPLGMWIWLRLTGFTVVSVLVLLTGALAASVSGSLGELWTTVFVILFPILCFGYRRRTLNASRDSRLVPPN